MLREQYHKQTMCIDLDLKLVSIDLSADDYLASVVICANISCKFVSPKGWKVQCIFVKGYCDNNINLIFDII